MDTILQKEPNVIPNDLVVRDQTAWAEPQQITDPTIDGPSGPLYFIIAVGTEIGDPRQYCRPEHDCLGQQGPCNCQEAFYGLTGGLFGQEPQVIRTHMDDDEVRVALLRFPALVEKIVELGQV